LSWLSDIANGAEDMATGELPLFASFATAAVPELTPEIAATDATVTFGIDEYVRHDGWKQSAADAGLSAATTLIPFARIAPAAKLVGVVAGSALTSVGASSFLQSPAPPAPAQALPLVNLGTATCRADANADDKNPTGMYPVFAPAQMSSSNPGGVSGAVFQQFQALPRIFCASFAACGNPSEASPPPTPPISSSIGQQMNDLWNSELGGFATKLGLPHEYAQIAGKKNYQNLVGELSGDFSGLKSADGELAALMKSMKISGSSANGYLKAVPLSLHDYLNAAWVGINQVLVTMHNSLQQGASSGVLSRKGVENSSVADDYALTTLEVAVAGLHEVMSTLRDDIRGICQTLESPADTIAPAFGPSGNAGTFG
jgi:hypothetical protein